MTDTAAVPALALLAAVTALRGALGIAVGYAQNGLTPRVNVAAERRLFEVTTAAAFLAFARTPAAATIVEVGLGGRLDATNVIPNPVVTGIAALGIDHQAFLGDTLLAIARQTGTSVAKLKDANDLRSSRLQIGQRLVIPSR